MFNSNFANDFRSSGSDKVAYFPTNRDEDNDTRYYGLVTEKGVWYIIQDVVSTGITKYAVGKTSTGYVSSWTGRSSLTYKYIYEV